MTMTIKQAAEHHSVSDKTIRRWIKQGHETQIDHLAQLLAMQTKQNALLIEQLPPPPLLVAIHPNH